MIWLALVIITVFVDTIRIFIDNYVSDEYYKGRGAVAQKLFYGYALIVFSLIMLVVGGLSFEVFSIGLIAILLLAGFINGISGVFYYKALEIDNSTNLGIFIQMAPVLYLVIGWLFLGEQFKVSQLVALGFIMAAPLLIVLLTRKKSRKMRLKAVFYSFVYVLIAVISNLVFLQANATVDNLICTIALVLMGKGVANLVIVYMKPKLRRRFQTVLKTSKRRVLRPMVLNFFIGATKEYVYRAALIAAPTVAVASAASDSAEPIVIFFMGIVLTLIWPKFGREKLNRKSVLIHLLATILVVVGIVILQL